MEKKIRFGDLVRRSGRPQTVTLWTKPDESPALKRALKQNRVLTVVQETGKKDHGFIGFKTLPGALYLEFPRPLPQEQEARVIGVNYQLIQEPEVPEKDRFKPAKPSPVHPKPAKPLLPVAKPEKPPPKEPEPVAPKPQPREFIVRVRRVATIEEEIRLKALDRPEAERLALERVRHKAFKPGKEVRVEIVRPEAAG